MISSHLCVQKMSLFIFVSADSAGNNVSRLEGAISHHGEDINDIMGKTVYAEKSSFTAIIGCEISASHLHNAVVYSFVSADGGL